MSREDPTLRLLRRSRSKPPHRAGTDNTRRSLYGASLEQFEQLLTAAEAIGPAARPLPLFYALNQAGRAIVAARGESAEIYGHGLTEDRQNPQPADLLHRRVKRRPSQNGRDAFSAVSRAIGSPEPKSAIEIGEAWVSLPNTFMIPELSWQPHWRQVLTVFDRTPQKNQENEAEVQVASFGGNPYHNEANTLISQRYPSLPNGTKMRTKGSSSLPKGNWIVVLSWDAENDFDAIAPASEGEWGTDSARYIQPTLADERELLNPLMLWWVVLFGLSLIARYQPGLWVEALELDHSELAVPLEGVLDSALTSIPSLVHHELLGV
jgi:hypothetical protein